MKHHKRETRYTWTPKKIRRLGPTLTVEVAGLILGIGRTKAYQLVQDGEFPVQVLRVGRRILVPTARLLELLGYDIQLHPNDERPSDRLNGEGQPEHVVSPARST
jgi:hypothetical protein